jgi:hypothetical protein
MNKIKEIIIAWATKMNPTEEQKQIAEQRLQICMTCEFWKSNAAGIEYCSKCGCATKGKVFSPRGADACPEKKWTI